MRFLSTLIAAAFFLVAVSLAGVLRSSKIRDAIFFATDTSFLDIPMPHVPHVAVQVGTASNSTSSAMPVPTSPASQPNSTCEVVVAHYNEDITWLRGMCQRCALTLYHKGSLNTTTIRSALNYRPDASIIHLPNRGREGETWLQHIIRRYNTLADSTIFVQGELHFANGLDGLPCGVTPPDLVEACALDTAHHPGFHPLGNFTVTLLRSRQYREAYAKWISAPLQRTLQQLWGSEFKPTRIKFHAGAIFSVTRDNILFHPRNSYQIIEDRLLSGNERKDHEYSGYMLERLWNILFDGKHKMTIDEAKEDDSNGVVDGGNLTSRVRKKKN